MEIEEELDQDIELSNPMVVDKFKAAADIANRVMIAVLEYIQPGQNVVEICAYGDKLIEEVTQASFKKVKKNKGLAFPTCVSINNCAGHLSPLPEDPPIIVQAGDLLKV
jgi:methionine aminopeptidase